MKTKIREGVIKIDFDDLLKKIKGFDNGQRTILQKAVRQMFSPISKEIKNKQKAGLEKSKDTGKLRKAIGIKTSVNLKYGIARFIVGPRKKQEGQPSRYAHLIENGTKPHTIKTPRGKKVQHPGTKAQPWLKPSYQGVKEKVNKAIKETLEAAVAEILAEGKK